MIKQKSIIFYVALLSITFSVVGILFYSGYFFYDYYLKLPTRNQGIKPV